MKLGFLIIVISEELQISVLQPAESLSQQPKASVISFQCKIVLEKTEFRGILKF